jgi:hypothetical protein
MQKGDKLVTIYRALGQPEAEIIRGRLQIEGIPVFLKYESLGMVDGLTMDGLGQVEVQVPAASASEAIAIINMGD